jgi:site-specific DNA-methyltransferase (adenine-specific)
LQIDLHNGDCLELMKDIPDGSVDLVLTDPPYGTTACKWDSVIPFEPMWEQLNRIIKPNGAICLFGSEPFSSALRMSNIKNYKYDWIWNKNKPSNFQVMNYQCGRIHELICVFSSGKACYTSNNNSMRYYPQKTKRDKPTRNGGGLKSCKMLHGNNMQQQYNTYIDKHPTSILEFTPVQPRKRLHPTQKPVELLEYLIKTYTQENETVLDFTMGSGSTGVACINTGRNFIGIELDPTYFDIAQKRIAEAQRR